MSRAWLTAMVVVLAEARARGDRSLDLVAEAAEAGARVAHLDDDKPLDLAQPPHPHVPPDQSRLGVMLAEAAIVFGVELAYYWGTARDQAIDWDLDGSWHSWKEKLFGDDAIRFDTNPFYVNALRHPLAGMINYKIARSNGRSWVTSTAFAYLVGAVWEYLGEYREYPSINDMIFNGAAGLAVGEPAYQFGQLWRSPHPSVADRLRTAVFSSVDALHDLHRPYRGERRQVWRSVVLEAGVVDRRFTGGGRAEGMLVADLDLVAHPAFVAPGAHGGATAAGAWSRIRAAIRGGEDVEGALFHSSTSVTGYYSQTEHGTGVFAGAGAAFTYRRDALHAEWDRLGIAHLFGPQLQLSKRTADYELRWDAAAYADFAIVQAIVFGPVPPFPPPPPYRSSLQVEGYYYAVGATATTRLRAQTGPWRVDLELEGDQFWQIDGHDRHPAPRAASARSVLETAFDVADWRVFGRAAIAFQPGRWGVAATADTAFRGGAWQDLERRLSDVAIGGLVRVAY